MCGFNKQAYKAAKYLSVVNPKRYRWEKDFDHIVLVDSSCKEKFHNRVYVHLHGEDVSKISRIVFGKLPLYIMQVVI